MKAGKGGHAGDLLQFEIVIQVLLYINERADDALVIILFSDGFIAVSCPCPKCKSA
jgi:hypothetical protein